MVVYIVQAEQSGFDLKFMIFNNIETRTVFFINGTMETVDSHYLQNLPCSAILHFDGP